jgi:heptosyltransferase I
MGGKTILGAMRDLEAAVRSVFLRGLFALFGARPEGPPPDWRRDPLRILFLRDDGIGDLVLSVEVLRAIAASNGRLVLDVLASPRNAEIARTLPFLHDVLVYERGGWTRAWRVWRELRRRRYDAVIDGRVAVQAVNTQTALLLLATRARWRIGIGGRRNDSLYTMRLTPRAAGHCVDTLVTLASPFGVEPDSRDWRPRLTLPAESQEKAEAAWSSTTGTAACVLLNISAGKREREWPEERYAAVLTHLRRMVPKARMLVLSMPADRGLAERLAAGADARAISMPLFDTMALVASADFVITPDTGITHIAAAFERPTVNMMPAGFEKWAPYRTRSRNVVGADPRHLAPLPVEPVLRAIDELAADVRLAASSTG